MLAAIKSDKQLAAGDRQKAVKLAEEKILPHVDFEEATRLAVGRGWKEATPEQRKKLVGEFRSMLVRTYSNAIGTYEGQTMKVLPSRVKPGDSEATVRNQFLRPGGKPVLIDYSMRKTDAGLEDLRHRGRRREPGAHLPQRVRRGGEAGRRRRPDQAPGAEEHPRARRRRHVKKSK